MAKRQDLVVDQKGKFEYTVQVTGATLPLTGWTARMTLADQRGGTAFATYTQADYLSVDAVNGLVNIDIPKAVTTVYTWTWAEYDLYAIDASGQDHCILTGTIRVKRSAG